MILLSFKIIPFQSTPSMRRVTVPPRSSQLFVSVFQSTPSMRRVTRMFRNCLSSGRFQSTPSMRRVTAKAHKNLFISLYTFDKKLILSYQRTIFYSLQGKHFSVFGPNSGANPTVSTCLLTLRTTEAARLPAQKSSCFRNVQFYFYNYFPNSKIEGCPFPRR